ncbi:hypothetical protein PTSG_02456 [Salpingoeca rosetta]|uniref:BHLH domain-containing protein n=1 Tax=Salpingoeca rosetta (strain ATCC 50818 / BSB-021) TaxID=946362 RepID=F2U292_SALR5|nr:uncharacterized protein PTSG_02456 [Salpingoeca rosetta]EGD81744.1 hypothetical protein PTSG_02456 [Salpingoeca rosetta]|eukprot:XP_004996948.1 hypothetical protein PTSG_02456 [Salpingoeca rosetta]
MGDDMRAMQRKEHHNRLERQRRDDIKNRFNELRRVLPDDALGSKASRAKVLTAVADYIEDMETRNQSLEAKKQQLQRQLLEVRQAVANHEAMLQQQQQQQQQQQASQQQQQPQQQQPPIPMQSQQPSHPQQFTQ